MTRTPLRVYRVALVAVLLRALIAGGQETLATELKPETLKAWKEYERLTEKRIVSELESNKGFLVQDFLPAAEATRCRQTLASGGVFVYKMETRNAEGKQIDVPQGMIHHWLGSIFLPGVNLADLLQWIQNYDQQAKYFDEVEESRLLIRNGDTFKIFLRLKRKKIITVYYNTEHLVEYQSRGFARVSSKSYATKIAEVENAGTPQEQEKPQGKDSGFLWRLNSYWRFQQVEGGVVVDCESISLSRGIPRGLQWLIQGYVESVPKESVENTLSAIRKGFHGRTGRQRSTWSYPKAREVPAGAVRSTQ